LYVSVNSDLGLDITGLGLGLGEGQTWENWLICCRIKTGVGQEKK